MTILTRLSRSGSRPGATSGSTFQLSSKKLTQLTPMEIETWKNQNCVHGLDRRPLPIEKSCFSREPSLLERFLLRSFQALHQWFGEIQKALGILFFQLLSHTTHPRKRVYAQRKLAAAGGEFRRPWAT